jgi:alkaline phosphatase D
MQSNRRALLKIGAAAMALGSLPSRVWSKTFGYPRLLQGPMLGPGGTGSLSVWARASGQYPVVVQYATSPDMADARTSPPVQATLANDLTVVVKVDGLKPGTTYWYRVLVNGEVDRYRIQPCVARTAPAGPTAFRVGFGSCARIARDPEQRIFRVVDAQSPDLFFWLGDNVYADTESEEAFADEYRRQRNVASLQRVIRSVPQFATWDDHDFGYNNSDGEYPYKEQSLAVFKRYWANPAYGQPNNPGVYFEYSYAGIDFFFLDGRYHRSPNAAQDGPDKNFLGKTQTKWLKERLLASRAPFKILACGSGWSMADGPTGDTWAAFRTERDALFDFIRDKRIEGVVCLSGDSHVGELNCIPWSEKGGYDIYDLVSSPLAQPTDSSWVTQSPEVRMRPVYAGGPNFGLLEFIPGTTPKLSFSLFNEAGDSAWKPFTLTAADLKNGVSTWKEKIDEKELARRNARPAS